MYKQPSLLLFWRADWIIFGWPSGFLEGSNDTDNKCIPLSRQIWTFILNNCCSSFWQRPGYKQENEILAHLKSITGFNTQNEEGKKILLGNGLVSFSGWFFSFSPTASKSGITGCGVIPLANTDETPCSGLSLLHALPMKGFHRGDSQGREKETSNESKTVSSPVPTHCCHSQASSTGSAPKLED